MKHLILTSSIFYLLGLKITHNIETTQKMNMDTVHTTAPALKNATATEQDKNLIIDPQTINKDKEASGSGQLTAPAPTRPADKID